LRISVPFCNPFEGYPFVTLIPIWSLGFMGGLHRGNIFKPPEKLPLVSPFRYRFEYFLPCWNPISQLKPGLHLENYSSGSAVAWAPSILQMPRKF
jgi:hypothetical protein